MAFSILGSPKPQFFDSSGAPLVNGTISVLDPADDTNKASYPTYDDAEAATNPNDNPITLDSRGEPSVGLWGLDAEDYKIRVQDADGATIWTVDDITMPSQLSRVVIGEKLYPITSAETTASVTPTNYFYEPGDVRRYGAVGDGSTDDRTSIENAIKVNNSGGTAVYIPATNSFYKIDYPIFVRDDTLIYGDGYKSHVRNTRTSTTVAGDLRVFDFGNHTSTSLLAETSYALDNIAAGDLTVTTSTASDAGNLSVGDVIYLASTTLYGSIPSVQEFNEVTSVDSGTGVVGLKYGVHAAFTGGQNIYTTTSSQTDPGGNPRRVVSRCTIRDLRVTSDGGDWWHAAGGCWESLFQDLHIDSRSPAVLNNFARSRMTGIFGTFDDRAIEFAIGSHNSSFDNFDLTFKTTGKTTSSEPIVSLNEGAHDIVISDGRINASDHAGSRSVRFIYSKDCRVQNISFATPSHSGASVIDFSASSGDCLRNLVSDVDFTGNNSRFIQFDYGASVTAEDNLVTRSRFFGTASSSAINMVDGTRDGVTDCYFETEGFVIGSSAVDNYIRDCRFGERHPTKTVSAAADVRGIETGSTPDLRGVEQFEVNDSITSTSANNTVYTNTIALDTLEVGDIIEVYLSGSVSGTNDTKDIRLEAESTDIASISLAAGESGAFSIVARLAVLFTTTTKRAIAQEESAAGSNTRRTSFSLNTTTGTLNIDLEAWVANASDSISIDQYVVKPIRQYEIG